jgi:hypothetical protein
MISSVFSELVHEEGSFLEAGPGALGLFRPNIRTERFLEKKKKFYQKQKKTWKMYHKMYYY